LSESLLRCVSCPLLIGFIKLSSDGSPDEVATYRADACPNQRTGRAMSRGLTDQSP
jgi:hypothetical protein